ncbi:MAG: hypothetical protein FJ253_07330 [Phycisphaerae bacterium]|nr:hypothetical protein [Phycisphaerae bacterium]
MIAVIAAIAAVSLSNALAHSASGGLRPAVVEGRVVMADGAPAKGAVVVSDRGGQAVTDESGRFAIELPAADGASDLRLTAVASHDGSNLAGTKHARAGSTIVDDDIVLMEMQQEACSPHWVPEFAIPGVGAQVRALTVFDDGSGGGPALYAGGSFITAGGVAARRIAKWNGASWSALGTGMNGDVHCLAVFDDGLGGGPALYAGGLFTEAGGGPVSNVAKWNGVSWSSPDAGTNQMVRALAVFDDGSGGGPALYAGGSFTQAGGYPASKIAKWDGVSWSAVGSGMNDVVRCLAVFDDGLGGGPALYAGGLFTTADGAPADRIAKWDGRTWSALGTGMNNWTLALTTFDDGSGGGVALYAGGDFSTAGGVAAKRIAKWNGASWSALGSGMNNTVSSLTTFDDGSGGGPALIAGGSFTMAGGGSATRIAKWNGAAWSALGGGMDVSVNALAVLDDKRGGGPRLFAGGQFPTAGGINVNFVSEWSGTSWGALGNGPNNVVHDLLVFDDGLGGGPALYAGGEFISAGIALAARIAKWDGESWSALGSGLGPTNGGVSLAVFDDGLGGGPALYVGGAFSTAGGASANKIAKWDGVSWSPLGSGMNEIAVRALAVFDDGGGPALYAGGSFTTAGGNPASRIAKWDGVSWSAVGSGMNDDVRCLAVFDDGLGGGPALYAGGFFTTAGGNPASLIAKWDGASWSAVGGGVTPTAVYALEVIDDGRGGGPALYAGGSFTSAGGNPMNRIAKWNGTTWSALGSGLDNASVNAIGVYDDGSGDGPEIYAGGGFTSAGGNPALRIAKWDGATWSELPPGLSNSVTCFAVFDDGSSEPAALYMGGYFASSMHPELHMAKWQGCPIEPECAAADFNCDGVVDGDDLGELLGQWGDCPGCPADFNGDDVVDGDDLGALLGAWAPIK